MSTLARDLHHWFWRLVPANPILVRVVLAGGRRVPHLWLRMGYLAALTIFVVFGVIATQSSGASLADLAKSATQVFERLSQIQLGLICILAPIFTAAAITQEKDSQTYNILLSTPLTNGQIVLGSLLSRLYFVYMLLIAGVPLFCIMMVYGGVTGDKILLSFALAAGTATLTGAMAIAISVIRVGTGRTIFSFYLAIAMYLMIVYGLSFWPRLIPPEAVPAPGRDLRMSWLAAIHPFLALDVVLGRAPAPPMGEVAHYGFPLKYAAAYPAATYITMTFGLSFLLVAFSQIFVRHSAKEGEPTLFNRVFGRRVAEDGPNDNDSRSRKPRSVSHNPIAWREAVTGASAGGGLVLRYGVLALGLAFALLLLIFWGNGTLNIDEARTWLFVTVAIEVAICLFVATTTAATSMTREKESNTLELILATPLTSAFIIRGKIRGLVTASWPLLLAPYLSVALFAVVGFFSKEPVVFAETLLTLPIVIIAFTAFACMLGLQYSIKNKKTLGAVFVSTGIAIGVFLLLAGCAFSMREAGQIPVTAAFMPLSPVTAPWILIHPERAVSDGVMGTTVDVELARTVAFFASICSAAIYSLIGIGMHKSMVRNFDMTIRKQSA